MFEIKTFLLRPGCKIKSSDEAVLNADTIFVDVSNRSEVLKIQRRIDAEYVEGAILLKYQGNVLLDFRCWDLVDQLWAYLVNLIYDYMKVGESKTYFPDSPVKMELKSLTDELVSFELKIKIVEIWELPKRDFFCNLLDSATIFFEQLKEIIIVNAELYEYEIKRINEIRTKLM